MRIQNNQFGSEFFSIRYFEKRILAKDLHFHVEKVQTAQELKPTDHTQQMKFVNLWIMGQLKVDADFWNKIILGDEAHFYLDGSVNRQNFHKIVQKICK